MFLVLHCAIRALQAGIGAGQTRVGHDECVCQYDRVDCVKYSFSCLYFVCIMCA